jgi:uncharacterized protein
MSARSALYVGSVMHRRLRPRHHHFRYRAFWFLLDLDELPALVRSSRLFSYNRTNLFSLHDSDHGDGSARPVRIQIDKLLREAGIDPVGGRIELFFIPRTLGYVFNPLSIYFCRRQDGSLAALVYEVHNTFGERHSYLIPVESGRDVVRQQCEKAFYVSPFLDMNLRYEFRIKQPDEHISVSIRASSEHEPVMVATLTGTRREFSDLALLRALLATGAITIKVTAAIHWEGLRLWLKRVRLRPRPPAPASMTTIVGDASAGRKWS